MKKKAMAIGVCLMTAAMGMSAMAAPSVTGTVDSNQVYAAPQEGVQGGEASEATPLVWSKEIPEDQYTEEEMALVKRIQEAEADEAVLDVFGEDFDLTEIPVYDENGVLMSEEDMESIRSLLSSSRFLSEMMELRIDELNPSEENIVKIVFTVNNMTDSMDVFGLYLCKEHGWEMVCTEKTADNQVTAPFHAGTSLFALIYHSDNLDIEDFEVIDQSQNVDKAE